MCKYQLCVLFGECTNKLLCWYTDRHLDEIAATNIHSSIYYSVGYVLTEDIRKAFLLVFLILPNKIHRASSN